MNRRARIKGIANIPVRRKTETAINNSNTKLEEVLTSDTPKREEIVSTSKNNESIVNEIQETSELRTINNEINKTELSSDICKSPQENESNNCSNNSETNQVCQSIAQTENNTTLENKNVENLKTETTAETKTYRRWIPKPKPIVTNSLILRRPKPALVPPKEKSESVIKQNIENENPVNTPNTPTEIKNTSSTESSVVEVPEINQSSAISNDSIIKSPERSITSPLSPNKIINRARIRPTPKLIRRNSIQGSASESEDDGRRSRVRNDSVCSTTSHTTETLTIKEKTVISKDKLVTIKVHKLFRRSEQSKKVSEARKDFYHKFGSKIPDRKRLTMMDLIYYNPVTNPMPQKKPTQPIEEIIQNEKEESDENEDDPEEELEEEDSNPVPQVKVGPNGEIILDEQSLVIEQTGTKKGREKLANSQVVNVDDDDRAYGVYKRPRRSKDWTAVETLRFYRTLNTVGTDFSLMVPLFPGRTRRDLKMKFKKEEKINMQLIDKALTNPLHFDLSELEKQSEKEEQLLKEMGDKKRKRHKKTSVSIFKNRNVLAAEINDEDEAPKETTPKIERTRRSKIYKRIKYSEDENTSSEPDSENETPKKIQKIHLNKRDSINLNKNDAINIILSEEMNKSIENKEDNNTSDSEKECKTSSETKENSEATNDEICAIAEEDNQNCAVPNILPNDLSTVEPGSLMILSSIGPDGQQVYKVFMVTPGHNKEPVNLSDDIVQSLTTSLGSAQAVTLDLPVITEAESNSIVTDVT